MKKKHNVMFSVKTGVLIMTTLWLNNVATVKAQSDVMMQAFYWNVPADETNHNGTWWVTLQNQATELKNAGFNGIWVPCPAKGNWGISDMGYGIYDHYDLGNYYQKGTTETRFGSRQELENMIATMHQSPKINVYADVVLNHVYSSDENEEPNPAVKAYTFGEAHSGANVAYPTNEIKWVVPNASTGDYYIQIKGYNLDYAASVTERGYDVNINWTSASTVENGVWESEVNNGGGSFNVFPGSGQTLRAHIDYSGDIDEYKITVSSAHDIVIKLVSKREESNPWAWGWASQTNGYYPVAIWHNGSNLASSTLQARTNTNITYVTHSGTGEPNYSWNYANFHPCDANDWLGGYGSDEIIPNTKFFGNDFNTYNTTVQSRLNNWGYWLANQISFDGFRLDFVRGFQESFVAAWVNNLPLLNGSQRFVVGEYWGADYRIKNWVNAVAAYNADVDGFDFPLKSSLTSMCNGNQSSYNMAWLNHSGLVRNDQGNSLPGTSVVTFAENHDTGKEHDKWITKDFKMAYAYMLTHEGRSCVFYPHYYGITQTDASNSSLTVTAPASLHEDINKLIFVRSTYLGGSLTVLSEVGNPYPSSDTYNVYIARRQGNGTKNGAIVVINNNDSQTKGLWVTTTVTGYDNWAGQTLVNAFDPSQTVTVYADGRAYFTAPSRGYSIYVKSSDYVAYSTPQPLGPTGMNQTGVSDKVVLFPNPASNLTNLQINPWSSGEMTVTVYEPTGRVVNQINRQVELNQQEILPIETIGYAPGVYFCLIKLNGQYAKQPFVVTR